MLLLAHASSTNSASTANPAPLITHRRPPEASTLSEWNSLSAPSCQRAIRSAPRSRANWRDCCRVRVAGPQSTDRPARREGYLSHSPVAACTTRSGSRNAAAMSLALTSICGTPQRAAAIRRVKSRWPCPAPPGFLLGRRVTRLPSGIRCPTGCLVGDKAQPLIDDPAPCRLSASRFTAILRATQRRVLFP